MRYVRGGKFTMVFPVRKIPFPTDVELESVNQKGRARVGSCFGRAPGSDCTPKPEIGSLGYAAPEVTLPFVRLAIEVLNRSEAHELFIFIHFHTEDITQITFGAVMYEVGTVAS